MTRLVLASTSPRRKVILKRLGLPFSVEDPGNVETIHGVGELVMVKNALAKARSVAQNNRDALVLAADTSIIFNQRIIGKPKGKEDARQILQLLSGHSHQVVSGVAVIVNNSRELSDSSITRVWLRDISSEEIQWYLDTKEGIGKAGAYAIQGKGGMFVERIDGCYFNVVGLPLSLTVKLLERAGLDMFGKTDVKMSEYTPGETSNTQ